MKLVTHASQAIDNIATLQRELGDSPQLVDRLGFVHSFYVDDRDAEHPCFGFSKWIGYQGLEALTYLRDYKELNGRNTEWALKDFFEELPPGSREYRRFHRQLTDWLASFGKTPRQGVRLMVLKSEHKEMAAPDTDRRLLDLLIAVSDLLPTDQQRELRMHL